MELINREDLPTCRQCKGAVSPEASICPHCGVASPSKTSVSADESRKVMESLQGATLTDCPSCGGKLSPEAMMCPHCGAPMRKGWYGPMGTGGEIKSKAMVGDRPLYHIAWGRDPATGKMRVAKGIFALGQFAKGEVAVGQFAYGRFFALGQFAASWGLAIGQFAIAPLCVAMVGLGLITVALFGVGLLKMVGMFGWSLLDGVLTPGPSNSEIAPLAPPLNGG